MIDNTVFTAEVQKIILDALKNGNSVELKAEHGKLVVVEIRRVVKIKQQGLP